MLLQAFQNCGGSCYGKKENMIPDGGYITNFSRFGSVLNGAQQYSSPVEGVPDGLLEELAAQLTNAG